MASMNYVFSAVDEMSSDLLAMQHKIDTILKVLDTDPESEERRKAISFVMKAYWALQHAHDELNKVLYDL